MSKAVEFLRKVGAFYVATDDNGQPRVRPFGAVMDYEGKIYFCTNNQKAVFKQLVDNPRIEICGCGADGQWIRITGRAVVDDNDAARGAMLELMPGLKNMYSVGDGLYEVFYLVDATATIYGQGPAETFSL
jgi:uncharacterized pyridoxamine 5'-phosphate oxidase family protein